MAGGLTVAEQFITTPRPPVTLKEARRATTDTDPGEWVDVFQVVEYTVPQQGAAPDVTVSARAILSRVIVTSADGNPVNISLRVSDETNATVHVLLPEVTVPGTGFLDLPLGSAVLGAQEVLQVKATGAGEAHLSASFVNSTREQFTVVE
jgi:hypothetical protein